MAFQTDLIKTYHSRGDGYRETAMPEVERSRSPIGPGGNESTLTRASSTERMTFHELKHKVDKLIAPFTDPRNCRFPTFFDPSVGRSGVTASIHLLGKGVIGKARPGLFSEIGEVAWLVNTYNYGLLSAPPNTIWKEMADLRFSSRPSALSRGV